MPLIVSLRHEIIAVRDSSGERFVPVPAEKYAVHREPSGLVRLDGGKSSYWIAPHVWRMHVSDGVAQQIGGGV